MEDDGSNVQRITSPLFHDLLPSWFPDGRQILFKRDLTRGNPIQQNALFYIIDVKSGKEHRFMEDSHHTDDWPVVSPDGKQIAFRSQRDGARDIYVLNLESGVLKNVTENGEDAVSFGMDWSPDSKQIVYENAGPDGNTIWTMNADGTRKKRVSPKRPPQFFVGTPSWSLSGKYIMYSEQERTPDWENPVAMRLMILNVQTGNIDVHDFPKETIIASFGCWMGDDRKVLLSIDENWHDETVYYDIFHYDLHSRKLTNLTNQKWSDNRPRWIEGALPVSPMGKKPLRWGTLKSYLPASRLAFMRGLSFFLHLDSLKHE